ncbi:hypothetical protein [Bacillus sp. AK128]
MIFLSNDNQSKLEQWRSKYAAIATAITCLCTVIMSWGNNWILTGILGLGVVVCGTMGFFDIKRSKEEKNKKRTFSK